METPKQIVEKWYQALATGDWVTCHELAHPEVEWIMTEGFPDGGAYKGWRSFLKQIIPSIAKHFERIVSQVEAMHEAGNTVVVTGIYHGTTKDTKQSFAAKFVHIWTIEDGKLRRLDQLADTAIIQTALRTPETVPAP